MIPKIIIKKLAKYAEDQVNENFDQVEELLRVKALEELPTLQSERGRRAFLLFPDGKGKFYICAVELAHRVEINEEGEESLTICLEQTGDTMPAQSAIIQILKAALSKLDDENNI